MSLQGSAPARTRVGAIATIALAAGCLAAMPTAAHAAPDGSNVVINEVYGGGGNSGATYTHDFIELYNPTDQPISLDGMGLNYWSASGGSGGVTALSGTIEPDGYFLVQEAKGNGGTEPLPTPDQTGSLALSGTAGRVFLLPTTSVYSGPAGDVAGRDDIIDMVGWGSAAAYEGAAAGGTSNATSVARITPGADSDDNATDFAVGAPTPQSSGESGGEPEPTPTPTPTPTETPDPEVLDIADVQGEGTRSPYEGRTVTVEGVVTTDYRTGGMNGFYIQDPAGDPDDGRSDGLFVYRGTAEIGQSVRVTGPVSEYVPSSVTNPTEYDYTTEITVSSGGVTVLPESLGTVEPLTDWTLIDTDAKKEAHEGELILPSGDFTVTDNYDANYYGSFGLAFGEGALKTPTEYKDADDTAGLQEIRDENAARFITLDDGATTNFNSTANKGTPLPYLTPENPVRVGSTATFHQPVVLEYRNRLWNFQPTTPVTDDGSDVVTFSDTRTPNLQPEDVGGDIRLATFNVLNYFPTTGEEYVASGLGTCSFYSDRDGNRITNNECEPNGPRGAANEENLARQQVKIVKAINGLGASIVSLEELENSAHFGKDRDFAISTLVDALNENAGDDVWAYVPSPEVRPEVAQEDVIRTGFIYKPADVELVGESHILIDEENFDNAREPLFQGFKAVGASDDDAFLVSVNHFKSKGSGVDDGTGQGNANPDRVGQAHALVDYTAELIEQTGIEDVFLAGDFNAYSAEDPVQVIEEAGFTELNVALNGGEATYNYDGMDGSLDHVFANSGALELVTGVDVWQINAQEQVGFEYSRYNYNATILYDESVFRASDHNPEIVGLDLPDTTPADTTAPTVTVKDDTIGSDGVYERVSFKLHDEGLIDRIVLNGVEKDLVDNAWSDLNGVVPGVFGAVLGANTLEVYDVAGNVTTVEFTLVEAAPEVPEWQKGEVYTDGDVVSYKGTLYEAQWWTTDKPGTSETGSWMEIGEPVTCAEGEVAAWTKSMVYTGGEHVVHKGQVYEAQWWTRNQKPGDKHGPWSPVGAC